MSLEFRVFSLNCWGIAGVSKDRKNRMQAIGNVLSASNYDVACLQEVWTNEDFYLIRDIVIEVLPYSHYFYSGVTGSGVCVFSKHPIQEAFFHQWSLNGYIHKLHHGDWFGGKGVGMCKLLVNDFVVNVYSAHLHAEYNRISDEYEAHRILQAYDTAQFIKLTSGNSDLAVIAGDLNTEPGDLAYRIMLCVPGLLDAFNSADDLPKEHIATCESLRNSYTPTHCIKKNISGKRIDYIMYHPGYKMQVEAKDYKLPLPDRVPNNSYSYSDHEAIAATLVLDKKSSSVGSKDLEDTQCVLQNSLSILNSALDRLVTHQIVYLTFAALLLVLLILSFVFHSPFGYPVIFNVLRIFITAVIIFCTLMATIWNKIERHGMLAGKLCIEITLKQFNKDL